MYVDDILIAEKSMSMIEEVKLSLNKVCDEGSEICKENTWYRYIQEFRSKGDYSYPSEPSHQGLNKV